MKTRAYIFIIIIFIIVLINSTAFSENSTKKIDSSKLQNTIITSHLEQKIVKGKNIIYCSTFQFAWNELRNNIVKEDIRLENEPSMVKILNKQQATKNDLSENSYVAMAGFGEDKILDKINKQLKAKFKEEAPVVKEKLGPKDILAYAYLSKKIKFKNVFENINIPIKFNSKDSVDSFGINQLSYKNLKLAEQVKILNYENSDNFIIKLIPKNNNDEIILAKIPPQNNIFNTLKKAEKETSIKKEDFLKDKDNLKIPKLDFNIKHSYQELLEKKFLNSEFIKKAKPFFYVIKKATQDIEFKLNEKGAVLKSEARIVVGKTASASRPYSPKNLVFDKPFLLYMKEKGKKNPYLVIWVDNPEILVKNN